MNVTIFVKASVNVMIQEMALLDDIQVKLYTSTIRKTNRRERQTLTSTLSKNPASGPSNIPRLPVTVKITYGTYNINRPIPDVYVGILMHNNGSIVIVIRRISSCLISPKDLT